MLKLKQLTFNNIGRFTEEQTITVDSLGNLVQIDGINKNTGGSSGAGKTTVFNALDYLLGLNDTPNTILQSRLTKEGISVSAKFDLDGRELSIARNKGKLSIDLEGDITTGSSKLSEERLDQIIGMPRHLFRPMLHKRQKEGGFFLKFTPKEIHEFLTDCLGLGDLRLKLDIIEEKVKSISESVNKNATLLMASKASLDATEASLLNIGVPPVKDIHQDVILQLKAKWEASAGVLRSIELQHSDEVTRLNADRPVLEAKIFDKMLKGSYEKERNDLQLKIYTLESAEKARQSKVLEQLSQLRLKASQLKSITTKGAESKETAQKIALDIKKLRENICPTCEQGWLTDTVKEHEKNLIFQLSACKQQIDKSGVATLELALASNAIENLTPQSAEIIPAKIAEIRLRLADLEKLIWSEAAKERDFLNEQNSFNKIKQDEFASKQNLLREKHLMEASQVRGQADLDRRSMEAAVAKLRAYEEANTRYESTIKTQVQLKDVYIKETSRLLSLVETDQKDLLLAEELKRAIKSYTSCSFDDALEVISDTATRIIRNVPVMQNATIQLEGTKETKEGKIKEEVNAVISMDGDTGISIKSLSGGERSSIDLAVDLAVIDLIESKTGKGIDIFILDEPFTGLDTVSIEMALEVLKNSSLNKKLILVDHNAEVKQMVETRLVVERDGITSRIIQ